MNRRRIHPGPRSTRDHKRFETVQAANRQRRDVAVETVLAEQRACMPELQVGRVGYREPGICGVERTPAPIQAGGDFEGELRGLGNVIRIDLGAPDASQCSVSDRPASYQGALGTREVPGVRDGPRYHRRAEGVKDRGDHLGGDRTHRRRA